MENENFIPLQIAFDVLSDAGLNPMFLSKGFVDNKGRYFSSPEAMQIFCPANCFAFYERKLCQILPEGFSLEYKPCCEMFQIKPLDATAQFIANQIYQSGTTEQCEACRKLIEATAGPNKKALEKFLRLRLLMLLTF